MRNTNGEDSGPAPKYQKAKTRNVSESVKTDHVGRCPRSISTSSTEGTINVIIINKPDSTKNVDSSTS